MTRQERIEHLKKAIADISAHLKGPLSNLERSFLVADRQDCREELALIEAMKGKNHDSRR